LLKGQKNQKSKIKNQKSKIKNQKSKIKNQKSKIKGKRKKEKTSTFRSGGARCTTVGSPQIGYPPDPGKPVALKTCPISGPYVIV
jgi:hypothetical protein